MKYKTSQYQVIQQLNPNIYLCSSFRSGLHILLSRKICDLYTRDEESLIVLQREHPNIFERLVDGLFIVDADCDEKLEFLKRYTASVNDTDFYHIIVNPTLDCNLSCWYCYENKIKGSSMSEITADSVCRNISLHYDRQPYRILKLSFFGGEPLMRPRVVKRIIDFASRFCMEREVDFIVDFTTNGTLVSGHMLDYLSAYNCMFQITLDGSREQHNKIKFTSSGKVDAFSLTVRNIHRIQKRIPKSHVSVRINFDGETLKDFDSVISELKDLDRKRTMIIVKKVWQVSKEEISKELIFKCIDRLFQENFIVDYYSQGGICFADRKNQVTFNYDGGVFKCTTISKFDTANQLGKLNTETGEVSWDKEKIQYLENEMISTRCNDCKVLPFCGGHCRKHISEGLDKGCFLNELDMTIEEYALKQFQISVTKKRVHEDSQI